MTAVQYHSYILTSLTFSSLDAEGTNYGVPGTPGILAWECRMLILFFKTQGVQI